MDLDFRIPKRMGWDSTGCVNPEENARLSESGAKSGAIATPDPWLQAIIAAWPTLSDSVRQSILMLAGCATLQDVE